jgi:hypothetical protein
MLSLLGCLLTVSASAAEPKRAAALSTYRGWGFDTCKTPDIPTMRAWLASDYRAIGVYFGGRGRACKDQRHLTSEWARSVSDMGWRILPVYVGSQSPCTKSKNKKKYRLDSSRPWQQGTDEGRDAVRRAETLGFAPGSPIYLDMEAYDTRRAGCAGVTLEFVRAFNREVGAQDYLSGYYSSADSGVAHMERARRQGISDMPDVIWYARWKVPPTLSFEPVLDGSAWMPHRRIHQYAGNVKEKHGGRQLAIDRNRLDAPVALVGQ